MISFQDYCPSCKEVVEASPTLNRDELRLTHQLHLTDDELWLVIFSKPEVHVMHRSSDADHHWRLSTRTRERLRKEGRRSGVTTTR
jgi:hypothetical protein